MLALSFSGFVAHYAKMNSTDIENYIEHAQSIITEIDVLRASGAEHEIQNHMDNFKMLSDQAGAYDVAVQAETIRIFLIENADEIKLIHIQTRLDGFMKALRHSIFAYSSTHEK